MTRVAILGAGSWGTVLAAVLSATGHQVRLWTRSAGLAERLQATRRNDRAAPGVVLPAGVDATASLEEALGDTALVLVALPTDAVREVARHAAPFVPSGGVVVSCAKGFERQTNRRMSQVLEESLPGHAAIAVLSGPNLAGEIAEGRPAAAVIAASQGEVARAMQRIISSARLRLYANSDVIGVEFGGALKNCVAIAAGVADGLHLGVNGRAALITRGLAEIARLGVAAGAQALTFSGLAGIGDLVATCSSPRSRNYQVGLRLAAGETWPVIQRSLGHVAEGVNTTAAARTLAARYNVRTPIIDGVYDVLYGGRSVQEALDHLMEGPPGDELADLMTGR